MMLGVRSVMCDMEIKVCWNSQIREEHWLQGDQTDCVPPTPTPPVSRLKRAAE